MANLKEVRTRIESVKSTKQITGAMKLVAASKLRRAQNAITSIRPYANKLQHIMQNVSEGIDVSENPYVRDTKEENILIIPITSNKGLCGAFNANIIKGTSQYILDLQKENKDVSINLLTIGKKGSEFFTKKTDFEIIDVRDDIFDNLSFPNVSQLAETFMKAFVQKTYDKVYVVYNSFVNAASQKVTIEQVLPMEQDEETEVVVETKNEVPTEYIFEPNKEEIIEKLIPKSIKMQFYKSLLDSYASEHGARMTAMHQATDNATELLRELKLSYNKARQEAITNQILEVTTGAEALNG